MLDGMAWYEAGKAGALLGVLVIGLQVVATGTNGAAWFPIVATLVELVVLVALLRRTREGAGYVLQVAHGLVATVVSLPFVTAGFLLSVLVLFPDALGDAAEVLPQGVAGLVGTLMTGLVVSGVAAAFLRDRGTTAS